MLPQTLLPFGDVLAQPGLNGDQEAGDEYEYRDDMAEHSTRQDQQEHGTRCTARHRSQTEMAGSLALASELSPVANGSAERAGNEPDGVRDVGHDRRVSGGQQGGEREERARADNRVDRPGDKAGGKDPESSER